MIGIALRLFVPPFVVAGIVTFLFSSAGGLALLAGSIAGVVTALFSAKWAMAYDDRKHGW